MNWNDYFQAHPGEFIACMLLCVLVLQLGSIAQSLARIDRILTEELKPDLKYNLPLKQYLGYINEWNGTINNELKDMAAHIRSISGKLWELEKRLRRPQPPSKPPA